MADDVDARVVVFRRRLPVPAGSAEPAGDTDATVIPLPVAPQPPTPDGPNIPLCW